MPTVNPRIAWKAVLARDRRYDGMFVYAVSSTNIYCRPSCPSRRPSRRRVMFFASAQLAEQAGFRSCRRCEPHSPTGSRMEQLVDRARRHVDAETDTRTSLKQLAILTGTSPFHLQRVFTRMVGLSPMAYQHAKRIERFSNLLRQGHSVTTATYEAGFGSASRVSGSASRHLGMTPSAYRSGGAGVTLQYATVCSPIGHLLVAATEWGLVSVTIGENRASLLTRLKREYPNARLRPDPQKLRRYTQALLRCLRGQPTGHSFPLDIPSTVFQQKVWQMLRHIPPGFTRTYREIASDIGQPGASRAVARACATNPLALVIPCHRVLRQDGRLAGYRWGVQRKKRLLALERRRAAAFDRERT